MNSTATRSYLMQRVSGAIMTPISIWVLFFLLPKIGGIILKQSENQAQVLYEIFGRIDNITYMLIFVICGLYHGVLGIQTVVHDYIHCSTIKKIVTIIIYGLAVFSMIFLGIFCIDIHVRVENIIEMKQGAGL